MVKNTANAWMRNIYMQGMVTSMEVNPLGVIPERKKNGLDDKDASYELLEKYRNCLRSIAMET
jgi:hypothetical protein